MQPNITQPCIDTHELPSPRQFNTLFTKYRYFYAFNLYLSHLLFILPRPIAQLRYIGAYTRMQHCYYTDVPIPMNYRIVSLLAVG